MLNVKPGFLTFLLLALPLPAMDSKVPSFPGIERALVDKRIDGPLEPKGYLTAALFSNAQYKIATELVNKYKVDVAPINEKVGKAWAAYQEALKDWETPVDTLKALHDELNKGLFVYYVLQHDLNVALQKLLDENQKATLEFFLKRIGEYLEVYRPASDSECCTPKVVGLAAVVYTEAQFDSVLKLLKQANARMNRITRKINKFSLEYEKIYNSPDFTPEKLEGVCKKLKQAEFDLLVEKRQLETDLVNQPDQKQNEILLAYTTRMEAYYKLFINNGPRYFK